MNFLSHCHHKLVKNELVWSLPLELKLTPQRWMEVILKYLTYKSVFSQFYWIRVFFHVLRSFRNWKINFVTPTTSQIVRFDVSKWGWDSYNPTNIWLKDESGRCPVLLEPDWTNKGPVRLQFCTKIQSFRKFNCCRSKALIEKEEPFSIRKIAFKLITLRWHELNPICNESTRSFLIYLAKTCSKATNFLRLPIHLNSNYKKTDDIC